jgi:hypothetical protein
MKVNIGLAGLLSGFLFYNSTDAQLPVAGEQHHKVVLQNDYVRVLEGRVPAHDTTPPHLHAANSVVVFLSHSRFGIQKTGEKPVVTDVDRGDMKYVDYGDKPVTHIVWNETAPLFHFLVVELARPHPGGAACPTLSRPGLSFQWKQSFVQAYYLQLTDGQPCRLTGSNCARFLIDLSGTTTAISKEGTFTRQPDGFVFFPPGNDIDIRGNNTRCILLEIR